MQQFSVVISELRKWFESFKWYQILRPFELHILFGALGIKFLRELLYLVLPYSSYGVLSKLFFTVPLSSLAAVAFLLGVWITLVSKNINYLPYALWANAFVILFPFDSLSLSLLISAGVYGFLGYALFKYTASEYARLQ